MIFGQAAEAIAVAAAQLLGGMPDQQREAEAFVGTELANDNMDLCNQLVVRLKRTVDVNEGGVWVSRVVWSVGVLGRIRYHEKCCGTMKVVAPAIHGKERCPQHAVSAG